MTLNTNDTTQDSLRGAMAESQKERKAPERVSVVNLNQALSRPFSRHSTGELVMNFVNVFKKMFNIDGNQIYQVVALDAQEAQTPISAVVIYGTSGEGEKRVSAVRTLLLESSIGGRLPARQVNAYGRNLEIPRVAGDVFDDRFYSRVESLVKNQVGGTVVNAGVSVIPTEVTVENQAELKQIGFHASSAIWTVLGSATDTSPAPFNISQIDTRDSRLQARIDYSPASVDGADGLPNRSDIGITLVGSVNENARDAITEQARDIVRIDGFVDLTFVPRDPSPAMAHVLKTYQPRFVITRWDTQVDAVTPELMLLGLSTATLLNVNMQWANVFRPIMGTKGVDTKDIGAIGFDINLNPNQPKSKPARIDTKADTFGQAELAQLIMTTMYETLVFSLDLPETGELSWLQNSFFWASQGDKRANDSIIASANALTNGHFNECYKSALQSHQSLTDAVAYSENLRVPLGYFKDGDQLHDIREIDMLAVLNIVNGKDDALIEKWSEVYDDQSIDPNLRLVNHLDMLSSLLSDRFYLKGYAQRVTLNPAFIEGLQMAVERAGLVIHQGNTQLNFHARPQRGNANVVNYAVGNMNTGLFRSQNRGPGNFRSYTGGVSQNQYSW